jgi:hypothetical protein
MKKKAAQPVPGIRYVVAVLAVVVLVLGIVSTRRVHASPHPSPRAGLTHEHVQSAEPYAAYPRIRQVYEMAARIPHVLDGLYCHCDCSKHSNHRSLLTCFQDDHGAGCDVCLTEAALAYQMTQEGKSLKEIRDAVDALYQR